MTERINEICGRMSTPDYSALQTALKGSTLWANSIKPTESVMDVVLKGSALSAALAAPSKWSLNPSEVGAFSLAAATKNVLSPSLTALAAMEMQTGELARRNGIAHLTSVASQLSSITDVLSSQTEFVREMIAPSTMLSDLQKVAERTHKSIIDAGSVTAWQLGVLDSASFLVDRHVDWASRFWSTTPDIEPFLQVDEIGDFTPKVNIIEQLPEELEYERSKNEDITPSEALEKTPSFLLPEKGIGLVEKIVNINKTCRRLKREPIFKLTDATMMAAATLSGTVCTNSGNFGNVIDCLYFVFYENLKHIKKVVTDNAVRKEDIYQCIFRVKDMRTDIRHDYDHGDNIEKKTRDIAESYSHYTGKVILTSSDDFITTQDKLYDDFYALTEHLQETIEKQG